MSIDNLRSALPSYAKDMNLNLSSLPRITSLTEQQLWGAILATAAATRLTPSSSRLLQRLRST